MIAIGNAPSVVEKATERQTLGKTIFTRLCSLTSEFVACAARALSQYYLWLQRSNKPW
jgi:hypothetical protein